MSRCVIGLLVFAAMCGCADLNAPHLEPGGQAIQQNLTYAPLTSASVPAQVSRSSGTAATISATNPTQSVSLNNGSGACVTEQIAGGFQPGATLYSFTFVSLPGAPANCTQTVIVTLDQIAATFYVLVP